jgi:hypothetical protein
MAKFTDFIEEEPLLQSMGHQIGATIDRMSKCHPELTGDLTKELKGKKSRRAHEYMCAYHAFHHQRQQAAQASYSQQQEVAIPMMIELLVKKLKVTIVP